jgi:hypothetical protein
MKGARASVFVSLAEGYGLPVAESLWHGKPCLCSNEGSIGEIAKGGGCLQVNPSSLYEIEEGFETLATDSLRYGELLHEVAGRRMKSWKEYADEIVEKLVACSEWRQRPEAPESSIESRRASLLSGQVPARASGNDRGDDGSRQAIFLVSASDLTVHEAYRSGGSRSIDHNAAIRFDHACDGAVQEKTLFYGPYAALPAGRFAFRFDGEIDGELGLAFTANAGARRIARAALASFNDPVIVEFSEPVESFEIIGTRTPSLRRLVLRYALAELRGPPGRTNGKAAPAALAEGAASEEEATWVTIEHKAALPSDERVYARDADGNVLSLPFVLAADRLRVHDAFGTGSQNRLRVGSTISFDGKTHADVAECRLFFGPYFYLEPGEYTFQFRGALDGPLRLRFTKAFGAEILREVVVTDFTAPVHVPVGAAADKVEIVGERLKDTKRLTISSIELAMDPAIF